MLDKDAVKILREDAVKTTAFLELIQEWNLVSIGPARSGTARAQDRHGP